MGTMLAVKEDTPRVRDTPEDNASRRHAPRRTGTRASPRRRIGQEPWRPARAYRLVARALAGGAPGTLSALSLSSFAGGIAGVPSGLPLSFCGGFPRCLLSEFRIASLLLGFQRGLTSCSLGDLRSG